METQGTTRTLWLTVGIGLALILVLLLLGFIIYFIYFLQHELPEERKLKKAINDLRIRLHITAADGFFLPSERSRGFSWVCHRGRKQPMVIQQSFVEAAARLSLFQDFDIHQFDAFCLCLRCSRGSYDDGDSAPSEYFALCDWLLDICSVLIRPVQQSLSYSETQGSGSFIDSNCKLAQGERFLYFQKRVCRARVWSDMGGSLFQRLKKVAQACVSNVEYAIRVM